MTAPRFPRPAALVALALLGPGAMLPGCAHLGDILQPHEVVQGEFRTPDHRPLLLSGTDQQLLLEPGAMTITIWKGTIFAIPRLAIETGKGKLLVKLHEGTSDLSARGDLRIVGGTLGLSADIKGDQTWVDMGTHSARTRESCTHSGTCKKEVYVEVCDAYKCRNKSETREGSYPDCPGMRDVTVHYQDSRHDYSISFLKRGTPEPLGGFKGQAPVTSQETGRSDQGTCS